MKFSLRPVLVFVALLAALLAGCGEQEPSAPKTLVPGDRGPDWTGTELISGESISYPEVLEGSPAVLVFWATWCPYCKAFMPYTKAIAEDYAEAGVKIITFNAKERGQGDPRAYVASLDIPMVAIADADPIADSWGVEFIPGLMVVRGDGRLIYQRGWTELPAGRTVAQQWDGEVRAALDEYLAGG